MKSVWFAVLAAVVFAGCTTTSQLTNGKDFDEAKKEQIIKGSSKKADVIAVYGEPLDKSLDEKYNEIWSYVYTADNSKINLWDYSGEGTSRVKKLVIIFDQNDIVQNYVYSDATSPIKHTKTTQ